MDERSRPDQPRCEDSPRIQRQTRGRQASVEGSAPPMKPRTRQAAPTSAVSRADFKPDWSIRAAHIRNEDIGMTQVPLRRRASSCPELHAATTLHGETPTICDACRQLTEILLVMVPLSPA